MRLYNRSTGGTYRRMTSNNIKRPSRPWYISFVAVFLVLFGTYFIILFTAKHTGTPHSYTIFGALIAGALMMFRGNKWGRRAVIFAMLLQMPTSFLFVAVGATVCVIVSLPRAQVYFSDEPGSTQQRLNDVRPIFYHVLIAVMLLLLSPVVWVFYHLLTH